MKRKNKIWLTTAAFCLTLGMSVASVGCSGSYEMTDFVVDGSTIVREYEVGDLIDLSSLKMYALYSDDSKDDVELGEVRVYLGEEDVTDDLSKITESAGTKTVVIKYENEYGSVSRTLPTITVKGKTQDTPIEIEPELVEIVEFNKPQFLAEYQASLASATNDATAENFEGAFFKNDVDYYVVGDDNAFVFVPKATSIDFEADEEEVLENFTASTTVKIQSEDGYKLLEKKETDVENEYEYYDGDTLYLTEKADKNEYLFNAVAQDRVFLISVLPDTEVYTYSEESIDPVQIEVKVTDGFNVYSVQELCVLDNATDSAWDSIKGSLGLLNVDPNAVILHANMFVTEAEVPATMKYTLSEDYKVYYRDEATKKVGTPEEFGLGRTFLWDKIGTDNYAIYRHYISKNGSFAIYGNYFELDASKLPLVASFEASVVDGETWYGADFSNTTLLQIYGDKNTVTDEEDEEFSFYNLAVRGNAKGDQLVVDSSTTGAHSETLIYGGGIIFVKVQHASAFLENVRAYTFFIPFFANTGSVIEYNRTKCYDSFQNAIYAWSKTDVTVKNSYFQRAGGPLIIMVHEEPDEADPLKRVPQMNVDENSVLEAYLTGSEVWFNVVKASSTVEQIKSMDQIFQQFGKTILKDGKLNLVALLMSDSFNADEALTDVTVQGKFTYRDAYLDRMNDATYGLPVESNPIKPILALGAPTFNVGTNVMYLNEKYEPTFFDPSLAQTVLAAFADPAAEHVVMNMGGVGLVLGYNNVQKAEAA